MRPVTGRLRRRLVVAALMTCALGGPAIEAHARVDWTAEVIQVHDLAAKPLALKDHWHGGVLRVELSGPGKLPPEWTIRLRYGSDAEIVLDQRSAESRIVDRSPSQVTLDLPILGGRTLTTQVMPAALKLRIVAALFPSRVQSQQMLPGGRIDLFDADVGAAERALGAAFGRIDLLSSSGSFIATCTAFRVAVGYWLTAGHCVARDADHPGMPDIRQHRLQPIDYADRPEGPTLLKAVPVATGQSRGVPDPSKELQPADLDYAVLHVPGDTGGPVFKLSKTAATPTKTPLQLFQNWTGSSPKPGKARCADGECVFLERLGADDPSRADMCPSPAFQHGCSSERGASGGPLVLRSTLELVGLHYAGGKALTFNCGLPARTLIDHLCAHQRGIAEKVTSCD